MSYLNTESYNMSTVTIQMIEENELSEKAADRVKESLVYIEKKMSFYLKESEVTRINQCAGLDSIRVSDETLRVIKESIKYSILTNGKFDITLGPVISSWGVFSNHEKILEADERYKLLKLCGYKNIIIDNNYVGLKRKGQKIDLGGIAKGYASDEAINIYKEHNIKSAMINIGGNVSVLGRKENNELWCVGIQNPEEERGTYIGVLQCEDTSIVTSGNYVRYFDYENKKYGHIINSENGAPVNNDLTSVTIICTEGIKADALSTAVFSMGFEKGLKFIKTINDVDAILITNRRKVYISSKLKNYFYKTNEENFEYLYF